MIARVNQSDLELIRLDADGDAVRHLPEHVRHAAEVLVAYVAGLDRGRREAVRSQPARPSGLRQIPPTDPVDLPGQGAGDPPGQSAEDPTPTRQQLRKLTKSQESDDWAVARSSGGGVLSVACTIISGVATDTTTPEVVLVWGTDTYRKCADKLT